MAVVSDPITEVENHIEETLKDDLGDYYPVRPVIVESYGGEFGGDDLADTMGAMVQRGPHAFVAYMGEQDRQEITGAGGAGSDIQAKFSVYVAARNLRSDAEQKQDAYPIIVATKRILRSLPAGAFRGTLGPETWMVKLETIKPTGDSPVVNIPGLVCFQINLVARLKLIWT